MTEALYRDDAYLAKSTGRVTGHSPEGGVILDRTIFYPTGGGQPGDSGTLLWADAALAIATTLKGLAGETILVPGEPENLPPIGAEVTQQLDWERRFGHMRVHTALHLLSVAVPFPVSGGSISAQKGRLDFDLSEAAIDRDALGAELHQMIARDLPILQSWITDAQLRADPGLVKTMSVRPPMGQGRVRLIAIGDGANQIDLQPCGGTHVARTGEIGRVTIGKIQNKGRQNRRIYLHLDEKHAGMDGAQ